MARCDEGYLCQVCREEVEEIFESSLYLMLVLGWIDPETLHTTPECHLRCNSALSQFIDVQTSLADDALNEYIRHVGSAVFAVPPGVAAGGFIGEGLFA